MTAKNQGKKDNNNDNNNDNRKSNGNENIYRNNSELADKNSYMVYELNNTFEDKDKDVLKLTSNIEVNYKSLSENNTNYKSENRKLR